MINISTQKAALINALAPRINRDLIDLNTGEDSIEIRAAGTPLIIFNSDLAEYALAPLSLDYMKTLINDPGVIGSLPPEILAAALESMLSDKIAVLGTAVNSSISVTGYDKAENAARFRDYLDFTLKFPPESGEQDLPLRLFFKNESGMSSFIGKIRQLPLFAPLDPGPALLKLEVCAGFQTLTLGELRSLESGDVVILDSCFLADKKVTLLSDLMRCYAILNEDDHAVTVCEDGITWTNRERQKENNAMADNGNGSIDDLKLSVDFTLKTLDKSIAEIRELSAGSVIDLGTEDLDDIALRINGQTLARGRLIQTGDHYGVQITDIISIPGSS